MDVKNLVFAVATAALALLPGYGTAGNVAGLDAVAMPGDDGDADVEKTLNLKNFNGISSSASVSVHYTQGGTYKVVTKGASDSFDAVDISVVDGLVNVKALREAKETRYKKGSVVVYGVNMPEVTLYVTAPSFGVIKNSGYMSFYSDNVNVASLLVGNSGTLYLNCGSIICSGGNAKSTLENSGYMNFNGSFLCTGQLGIKNSGTLYFDCDSVSCGRDGAKSTVANDGYISLKGDAMESGPLAVNNSGTLYWDMPAMYAGDVTYGNIGYLDISGNVKAGSVNYDNSGTAMLKGDFDTSSMFVCSNTGYYKFDGNLRTESVDFDNHGTLTVNYAVQASKFDLDFDGYIKGDISFKGGDLRVGCGGTGYLDLRVDCRSVAVNSGGQIDMSISGSADNTEFSGSGMSRVNTSRLNKY